MKRELFVVNLIKFNTNPAAYANVRWSIKFLRLGADESFLDSDRCRQRYRYVAVVVMIVRTHREHPLAYEEGWFAV